MELREFARKLNFKAITCGFMCSGKGSAWIAVDGEKWYVYCGKTVIREGREMFSLDAVVSSLSAMMDIGFDINDLNHAE